MTTGSTGSEGAAAFGAVLAGGRGARLGGRKALARLGGRPLVEYALGAVGAAGLEPLLVAKAETALPALDCELVIEPPQPTHPLCGMVAALRRVGDRPLVAIACDMPFAAPELLARLAEEPHPLVLVRLDGRLEPLPGRFSAPLLPGLEAALAARLPLRAALESLEPHALGEEELAPHGDLRRACFNVNDADDLARAEALLAPG